MASTYIDSITYLKQPTGLMLAPYVGNNSRLSGSVAVGASSLPIAVRQQSALHQYDAVYVFDGPNSEVLQAGSDVVSGATSIPLLNATQFAHAAGTVFCTDGPSGSLGEQIFTASRWIEDQICFQALWATNYTGEILTLPTMRAAIDNQNNLHFRPRHFPITAFTSISLMTSQQYSVSYDPTQAIIDADQQTVDIPILAVIASGGSGTSQVNLWQRTPMNRQTNAWITLAYTAGFAVGALPKPIERACMLLTSECFFQLQNPVGADDIRQGETAVTFAIRGDLTGESKMEKQARKLLAPYITQAL